MPVRVNRACKKSIISRWTLVWQNYHRVSHLKTMMFNKSRTIISRRSTSRVKRCGSILQCKVDSSWMVLQAELKIQYKISKASSNAQRAALLWTFLLQKLKMILWTLKSRRLKDQSMPTRCFPDLGKYSMARSVPHLGWDLISSDKCKSMSKNTTRQIWEIWDFCHHNRRINRIKAKQWEQLAHSSSNLRIKR